MPTGAETLNRQVKGRLRITGRMTSRGRQPCADRSGAETLNRQVKGRLRRFEQEKGGI